MLLFFLNYSTNLVLTTQQFILVYFFNKRIIFNFNSKFLNYVFFSHIYKVIIYFELTLRLENNIITSSLSLHSILSRFFFISLIIDVYFVITAVIAKFLILFQNSYFLEEYQVKEQKKQLKYIQYL